MRQLLVFVRYILLAGLVLPPANQAAAQSHGQIAECAGPFARTADEAGLRKAFGSANVTRSRIHIGEGFTEPGTVLFAKDPKRRAYVLWFDKRNRKRPAAIILPEGSDWRIRAPDDKQISLGATMAEIEQINGRPFTLYGFAWEQGGQTSNWKGGALDRRDDKSCILILRFAPHPSTPEAVFGQVVGDLDFGSSDPKMTAAKPFVSAITLRWPQ